MPIYAGIEEIGRKVSKVYVGVGSYASLVGRAFGEATGIAELVYLWVSDWVEILYELNRSVSECNYYRAESVGDYALFAGGYTGSVIDTVDVWNSSLVKENNLALSHASWKHASTTIGNYALFGLFASVDHKSIWGEIDCFDDLLTKTVIFSYQAAMEASAGRVGDYALFMGGVDRSKHYDVVTCVNSNLVTSSTSLSNKYTNASGGDNSAYCFVGGGSVSPFNKVEAFDSSLTKYVCADYSVNGYGSRGAGNQNYWITLQGDTADVYGTSLTKSIISLPFEFFSGNMAAFSNREKYAFFIRENSFLVVDLSLTCKSYDLPRNYGAAIHGTCLRNYMFGGSAYGYVLVARIC
jgi:hypothetical protein